MTTEWVIRRPSGREGSRVGLARIGLVLLRRAVITISGLVQGIGFRPFVYRLAVRRGLKGYVRNLGDAGVEIDVSGDEDAIRGLLRDLREEKPPIAVYTSIDASWLDTGVDYPEFTIDNSDLGRKDVKLSLIPPDISICDDCLRDLFDPRDRHYLYPFTCCALCGPRFTTITAIPYDRERTTMFDFPLCGECSREFHEPLDRRFNAQTICCPECGPRMALHDGEGAIVEDERPLQEAAKLLEEGQIVAVKGIGGIHLAVKAVEDDPILRLRERRKKPSKPFAIMSPGLEEMKTYAYVSELEEELLTSYARPIVALRKRDSFPLSEWISPGLHTIGAMLPYSGIHSLLFEHGGAPALVMTSANHPGEPMIVSNREALERLRGVADYFLLHDREIWARCDDSVLRAVDGHASFLRRSRGYAPMPIRLPFSSGVKAAAVGPELASTAAVLKEEKCYPTQHLGDLDSPESVAFLRGALEHMMGLLGVGGLDAVACDLHPGFLSRTVAVELAEEHEAELVEVQHHQAHLASLMAESGVSPGEEVVGIVCDGHGYGSDGAPWGGEILVGGYGGSRRVGHLEAQPMPGGDLCAYRYGRMLQGVLFGEVPRERLREFLSENCSEGFARREREIEVVFSQLEKGIYTPMTTSAGRLLDAVSCLLGLAHTRTYEGEGAMKLEAAAAKGAPTSVGLPVEVDDQGGTLVLKTSQMVSALLKLRQRHRGEDLAYAFQLALAEGLAEMAIRAAGEQGLSSVGFTGGVANNDMMTRIIHGRVREAGCRFLRHRQVPSGDGGISLGQAAVAAYKAL